MIFEYDCFRKFVIDWVKNQKNKGRGLYKAMAKHLRIGTTVVSQIFKGDRQLSFEHAFRLCNFIDLSPIETEYFMLLVMKSRAGDKELKRYYDQKLLKIKFTGSDLKQILPHTEILKEEQKTVFYSRWYFSAIRNLCATEVCTIEKLANHLKLSRAKIIEALDFLVKTGLCVEDGAVYRPGPSRTHIERDSFLVANHHENWRMQGLKCLDQINHEDEMFFTFPMSISKETALKLRERIINFIAETNKLVEPSKSEQGICLNIDYFKY